MTAVTTAAPVQSAQRAALSRTGLVLGLASAMSFGLSGSLARSLLDLGWSAAAVVTVRLSGAFLVLLIPCLLVIRRVGLPSRGASLRVAVYGVVAVAACQLFYFSAVKYLSVGTALLLEYTAPLMLIGWRWLRTKQRPATAVFVGAGLAVAGLVLVLDVVHSAALHPVGVLWALAAAATLCVYFVMSDSGDAEPIHPVVLTTGGMGVGALVLGLVGGLGLMPFAAATGTARLAGQDVPWWLPLVAVVLISAVLAYLLGIAAVRRLGSSAGSFVALTEVIFAVAIAVVLLGQVPTVAQLLGGVLVFAGIAVVQRGLQQK